MPTGISKLLTILFYLFCCAALIWASGLGILNRPFINRTANENRLHTKPASDKTSIQEHPEAYRLDKNLSDYEINILRRGYLLRVLKFSPSWDSAGWQTGAFYGTLLANIASA